MTRPCNASIAPLVVAVELEAVAEPFVPRGRQEVAEARRFADPTRADQDRGLVQLGARLVGARDGAEQHVAARPPRQR